MSIFECVKICFTAYFATKLEFFLLKSMDDMLNSEVLNLKRIRDFF